jgi:CBS domain-containing protein
MATIRDVMSAGIVTVDPDSTVAQAATIMAEKRIGSALVLEGEDLAGIFTERDIVRALSQDFDAPGHPIAHWMTRNPTTVSPDATVEAAMDLMLEGGFRHLPVIDDGRVVGVVSIRDLAGAEAEAGG